MKTKTVYIIHIFRVGYIYVILKTSSGERPMATTSPHTSYGLGSCLTSGATLSMGYDKGCKAFAWSLMTFSFNLGSNPLGPLTYTRLLTRKSLHGPAPNTATDPAKNHTSIETVLVASRPNTQGYKTGTRWAREQSSGTV